MSEASQLRDHRHHLHEEALEDEAAREEADVVEQVRGPRGSLIKGPPVSRKDLAGAEGRVDH